MPIKNQETDSQSKPESYTINTFFREVVDNFFSHTFLNFCFFSFLVSISFLIRWSVIEHTGSDYNNFLSPWFDYIAVNGNFAALKDEFSNYNPPYLYLLTGAVYAVNSLGFLGLTKIMAIKLISIFFDYFLAFWVYKVVSYFVQSQKLEGEETSNINLQPKSAETKSSIEPYSKTNIIENLTTKLPWIAFFTILFSPNVIFNSSIWAQSDAIYVSFLIMGLYYLLRQKYWVLMICFGLALSIKLQAVFFLPVIIVLLLHRKLNILQLLIVPVTFILTLIPALFAGRSWDSLIAIYQNQANTYNSLVMNAPTFYQWFGGFDYTMFYPFALLIGITVAVGISYLFWQKISFNSVNFWIHLGLLSSTAIPFFLPKMHERYFFLADIMSIIYVFFVGFIILKRNTVKLKIRRFNRFWIAIVINLISFFAYGPFISGFSHFKLPDLSLYMLIVIVFIIAYSLQNLKADQS